MNSSSCKPIGNFECTLQGRAPVSWYVFIAVGSDLVGLFRCGFGLVKHSMANADSFNCAPGKIVVAQNGSSWLLSSLMILVLGHSLECSCHHQRLSLHLAEVSRYIQAQSHIKYRLNFEARITKIFEKARSCNEPWACGGKYVVTEKRGGAVRSAVRSAV